MKILIVSPLFPPDIAAPAPYIKELATRLAKNHTVTVITYGSLPERVEGATVVPINKRQPLTHRMKALRKAIIEYGAACDVVLVENGSSSEFPAFIASFFIQVPMLVHLGDPRAQAQTQKNIVRNIISKLLQSRAKQIITNNPKKKPEVLPFKPEPIQEFSEYEGSWQNHLNELNELFTTYAKK